MVDITYTFNFYDYFSCLNEDMIPMEWKVAHITPIFKKGYKKSAANYRPESLASCICEVMESCVRAVIWSFWSEKNLIKASQFSFVRNTSCMEQLLLYMEDICSLIDEGSYVDAAYIDFSKAFNTVPHPRLLNMLSALGIKGNIYKWIKSFLSDRTEIVVVNGRRVHLKKCYQVFRGKVATVSGPHKWFWWLHQKFYSEVCRWYQNL